MTQTPTPDDVPLDPDADPGNLNPRDDRDPDDAELDPDADPDNLNPRDDRDQAGGPPSE